MKLFKKVIALILSAITIFSVMTASVPMTAGRMECFDSMGTITAYAATGTWKQQNGNWYYVLSSGSNATYWNEIDGYWYYFNASGVMQTGWLKTGTKYFYLYPAKTGSNPMGSMATGWIQLDGKWYYLSPSKTSSLDKGQMVTYWQQINGEWYYFTGNGDMRTGWLEKDGEYYFLRTAKSGTHPLGSAVTGWMKSGGKWYYFSPTSTSSYKVGQMVLYWHQIKGEWYYFTGNGDMRTGWLETGGKKFYLRTSDTTEHPVGSAATGWEKIDSKWYYFSPTDTGTYQVGQMVTESTYTIDGKTYLFDTDGSAFSGVKDGVYYKDGSPVEDGWTTINGKYVYIRDGVMLTSTWLDDDGKWYYLNADGTMKMNEWFKYNGGWYYLQSDGSAATGDHRINGTNYTFDSSGLMKKEEKPAATSAVTVSYVSTPYKYWSPFRNEETSYKLHYINGKLAYCIQFNRSSSGGSKQVTSLMDSAAWKSLSATAKTGITRATIVGYPNYDLGVSDTTAAAVATAMVIHEYQMKYRTGCGVGNPKTGLNSSEKNYDVLYKMAYNAGGDLWTAYKNITTNIANFTVRPSFNGGSYRMTENGDGTYTYVLEDDNGILKDYEIASTTNRDLTVYKAKKVGANYVQDENGNYLVANSSKKLGSVKVVLSRKGTTLSTESTGSAVALFDAGNSKHQTLVYGTVYEAVNAAFWLTFEESTGSLTIKKIDEQKNPLQGAEFALINNKTGGVYATLITDVNGNASLKNIPVGKYTLKETKAPEGYHLTLETRELEVKANANTETNSFYYTITNKPVPDKPRGRAYIFKRNQQSGDVMYDAEFEIYAAEDIYANDETETPDFVENELVDTVKIERGVGITGRLYPGKYYAIETKAPKGFKLNTEKQYFEIKENTREYEAIPMVTLADAKTYADAAGVYEYGTVTVNVVNAASATDKIAGAVINAYFVNGEGETVTVGTAVTDENGNAVFKNVALGLAYIFAQEKNMNSSYYSSADQYEVTLDSENSNTSVTFENALSADATVIEAVTMLSVYDEPFGVTLVKKDKETLQGLANAIINVYDADGNTVYSGETDDNGEFKITGIPAGEYTFEEIQAPDGYVLNGVIQSFTIAEDGTVSGDNTILDEKTEVTLHKTDLTTAEPVPGATIEVMTTDGEKVFEGVTDENGDIHIKGLTPNTYYFKETVAPSGYVLNTTVFEFTLNRDGSIEGDDTITNTPTNVVVQKFAKDLNTPQPGAEFEFFDVSGASMGKFVTDENGKITFSKLPFGTYTYKETAAPTGYALNTTVFTFTIHEDGSVTGDTTVENTPTSVTILKVKKGTDKALEGAEFEVFDSTGMSVGKYVTNQNGQIVLTKLPVGAYTYKETKAPEGYVLDDKTVYSFEIAEDGTVTGTLKVENEEEPKFIMPKTGAKGLLLMGGIAAGCFLASVLISKKRKNKDGKTAASN